ncbi:MAG: hypothetical protein ACPG47_11340, partial [Leucothrix sp.]
SVKTFLSQSKSCLMVLLMLASMSSLQARADSAPKFKRIPIQFIAALGDPEANSGVGAEHWGLWDRDPGPRGVWLRLFSVLKATGGYGPGGWQFDEQDWWLDENGLIMEKPTFPVAPGNYMVTGDREVTTVLTIHPKDDNGVQRWELGDNAKLFDVTHLPCRSARYKPASAESPKACSPASVDRSLFKIPPGSVMPAVEGCSKQDYAVLFIVGIEDKE